MELDSPDARRPSAPRTITPFNGIPIVNVEGSLRFPYSQADLRVLVKNAPEEVVPLFRRAQELQKRLEFWHKGSDRSFVYWVERRGRGSFLR